MSTFREVRKRTQHHTRGCAICGDPVEGAIQIVLREKNRHSDRPRMLSVGSYGLSFCEGHAVEVFTNLQDIMKQIKA